jgi:hypothetical protein
MELKVDNDPGYKINMFLYLIIILSFKAMIILWWIIIHSRNIKSRFAHLGTVEMKLGSTCRTIYLVSKA